jgi:hypothetical protein
MYADGESTYAIARALGVTQYRIRTDLLDNGLLRTSAEALRLRARQRPRDEIVIEQIRKLYRDGWSTHSIASAVGFNQPFVCSILSAINEPTRDKSEAMRLWWQRQRAAA